MEVTPQGIEIEQHGHLVTAVVDVSGVGHVEMESLLEQCRDRMRYENAHHFVIDMRGVTYLASGCIGALVTFLREIELVRGRIALANCHENVTFLFKVTRLDSVIHLYDELQDALDSF